MQDKKYPLVRVVMLTLINEKKKRYKLNKILRYNISRFKLPSSPISFIQLFRMWFDISSLAKVTLQKKKKTGS